MNTIFSQNLNIYIRDDGSFFDQKMNRIIPVWIEGDEQTGYTEVSDPGDGSQYRKYMAIKINGNYLKCHDIIAFNIGDMHGNTLRQYNRTKYYVNTDHRDGKHNHNEQSNLEIVSPLINLYRARNTHPNAYKRFLDYRNKLYECDPRMWDVTAHELMDEDAGEYNFAKYAEYYLKENLNLK